MFSWNKTNVFKTGLVQIHTSKCCSEHNTMNRSTKCYDCFLIRLAKLEQNTLSETPNESVNKWPTCCMFFSIFSYIKNEIWILHEYLENTINLTFNTLIFSFYTNQNLCCSINHINQRKYHGNLQIGWFFRHRIVGDHLSSLFEMCVFFSYGKLWKNSILLQIRRLKRKHQILFITKIRFSFSYIVFLVTLQPLSVRSNRTQ